MNISNVIVFLCLLFSVTSALPTDTKADDAHYFGDGADIYPMQNNDIQLVKEVITITDNQSNWSIDVEMFFKNHGEDTTIQMGFPLYNADRDDCYVSEGNDDCINDDDIINFKTFINGKMAKVKRKNGLSNPNLPSTNTIPDKVYSYAVSFKKNEIININHSYTIDGYSNAQNDWSVKYVLRTGGLWRGNIENLKIYFKTKTNRAREINMISPKEHDSFLDGDELTLYWNFSDYKPLTDLAVGGNRSQDFLNTEKVVDDIIYSSKRSFIDIADYQIRNIRNSIYSLYNYQFKSKFLQAKYYDSNYNKKIIQFSENNIKNKHKLLLNYLIKVENFKLKMEVARTNGLLNYENKSEERQYSYENINYFIAINRKKDISFAVDNRYLLFINTKDNIPLNKFIIPDIVTEIGENPITISDDGEYTTLNCYTENGGIVLLFESESAKLIRTINVEYGEIRSISQFDNQSKFLYTAAGKYDVRDGKMLQRWVYPEISDTNVRQNMKMVPGFLKDGSLLIQYFSYIIYRVDPNDGNFHVFIDFSKFGEEMMNCKINKNGDYIAGIAYKSSYVVNQKTVNSSSFAIWKIDNMHSINKIYSNDIQNNQWQDITLAWLNENSILQTRSMQRESYELWRHDLVGDTVNSVPIPIIGLEGGQNEIKLDKYFLKTYGPRLWDIETGRKISPWYEALDPFDTSNNFPLYDNKPDAVRIRDFWN